MNTLRVKEVAQKIGVCANTVWNMARKIPEFPKPFKLAEGFDITVWDESEIDQYLITRKQGESNEQTD